MVIGKDKILTFFYKTNTNSFRIKHNVLKNVFNIFI